MDDLGLSLAQVTISKVTLDRVEDVVSKAPHVSQYEVIAVSRMSAKLPPK